MAFSIKKRFVLDSIYIDRRRGGVATKIWIVAAVAVITLYSREAVAAGLS
jgi:stringent starvation protein B